MTDQQARSRDVMSRVYGPTTWRVYDALDRSLAPRGPGALIEMAGRYLGPGSVILDAGCRDARHLVELVRAHDACGVGIDPVAVHIEQGRDAVATAGLDERITVIQGRMERLPLADGRVDLVWCRDVLEHVANPGAAMLELARVLKRGGHMLVFTVFVTDRLEPKEAAMLDRHLANVAASLVERNVEAAFSAAGLVIEHKDVIGTEWREHAEERTRPCSRALLRLSRLRRREHELRNRFGDDIYEHVEAGLHWEIFQFLGKLQPTVYTLSKP